MDNNRRFWERSAGFYAGFMKRNAASYHHISERIRQCLNEEMKVLELACGSGQLTFLLADGVKHWEATDFSSAMLEEAKKRNTQKNISFSVQDATNLPYADGSYDAVLVANALHIMPCPHQALEEIFRVLKPGGLLFTPTFIWKKGAAYGFGAWFLKGIGFQVFHKWNATEFANFVENKGFLITESAVIGSNITPMCYLAAKKVDGINKKIGR